MYSKRSACASALVAYLVLAYFTEQHPGLQVQVASSDGPVDLTQPTDVFVRRDPELRGLPSQVFPRRGFTAGRKSGAAGA